MMKNKEKGYIGKNPRHPGISSAGNRGAALMIALITALVVMLAATLLISLADRMADDHLQRLTDAQLALSEASAADGLAYLIETQGTGSVGQPVSFELAGITTEFTLVETGTAGIRSGFVPIDQPARTIVFPCSGSMVSAEVRDDNTVLVTFYSNETFQPISDFILETPLKPIAGAPFTPGDQSGAVLVLQGDGRTELYAITPEGIVANTSVESIYIPSGSQLSASVSQSGAPFFIATNGSNLGVIYDVSTGEADHVYSPPGTCPVFTDEGTVFGSLSGEGPSLSIARVKDVFTGDFNNDGHQDIAFATSFSLSSYTGATEQLFAHAPGGSLVCFGDIKGRSGLVGMWRSPSGAEEWFRLGWDGFTSFIPENMYRMGWDGRFAASGNTMAGFLGGRAVVATSSGYTQELFPCDAYMGNCDGGEIDFFSLQDDGLEVFFNPVSGDGIRMVFNAVNTYRGTIQQGNTHVFSVYESEQGIQVFHTLEGRDS